MGTGLLSQLKAAGLSGSDALKGIVRGRRPVGGFGDLAVEDADGGLSVGRVDDAPGVNSLGPARVVTEGPDGEDDFTDARYWLAWVVPEAGGHDAELSLVKGSVHDSAVIPATNLAELSTDLDDPDATGTHRLPENYPVWVFVVEDADGVPRYVFHAIPPVGVFLVKVRKTGGSAGGFSGGTFTNCSWVYSLWDAAADPGTDTPLATGLAPTLPPRMSSVGYDQAADDSFALAYRNAGGNVVLAVAAEKPQTASATVVTDYRVVVASQKLQKKTRSVMTLGVGTESDWTDVHTGDLCEGS